MVHKFKQIVVIFPCGKTHGIALAMPRVATSSTEIQLMFPEVVVLAKAAAEEKVELVELCF